MLWVGQEQILKRRAAVERWKIQNREKYLAQKRQLSARPEYKAHRREIYHAKRQELIDAGLAPKKLGRPQLYSSEEALERKRQRARDYTVRRREKTRSENQGGISLLTENVIIEAEEASEAGY